MITNNLIYETERCEAQTSIKDNALGKAVETRNKF